MVAYHIWADSIPFFPALLRQVKTQKNKASKKIS